MKSYSPQGCLYDTRNIFETGKLLNCRRKKEQKTFAMVCRGFAGFRRKAKCLAWDFQTTKEKQTKHSFKKLKNNELKRISISFVVPLPNSDAVIVTFGSANTHSAGTCAAGYRKARAHSVWNLARYVAPLPVLYFKPAAQVR